MSLSRWNRYDLGNGIFVRYRALNDDTVQVVWIGGLLLTFWTEDCAFQYIEENYLKERKL